MLSNVALAGVSGVVGPKVLGVVLGFSTALWGVDVVLAVWSFEPDCLGRFLVMLLCMRFLRRRLLWMRLCGRSFALRCPYLESKLLVTES